MRKFFNPGWLLLLLFVNPVGAGVNCNGVPHTRLETTVCGDPVLQALDRELTAALKEARSRGVIDKKAVVRQLNLIARQCRRETHEAFTACLYDAEVKSLEWVTSRLGQLRKHNTDKQRRGWRYSAGSSARISQLQRQLQVAQSRLVSTGNPELAVLTLLGLLQVYEDQPVRHDLVSRLQQRLETGCSDPAYGAKWGAVLEAHNHTCTALGHPIVFSAVDQ